MTESMSSNSLGEPCTPHCLVKRKLDVCFMKMIPPQFLSPLHKSQRRLREKPLPYKLLTGWGILLFKSVIEKYASIALSKVILIKLFQGVKLCGQLRHNSPGNRHRPIFIALSMDGENPVVEIEILHPQVYTLEESKPAAIQQFDHKIEGIFEILYDGINFFSWKNDRDIFWFLSTWKILLIAEIFLQNMTVQKQQRIKCLVLRWGCDLASNRQISQVSLDIGCWQKKLLNVRRASWTSRLIAFLAK